MNALWNLYQDKKSLVSFLPKDIVCCIEDYFKYELSEKNLFGFNILDKKEKSLSHETQMKMFTFILDNIKMNLVELKKLKTIDGLSTEQKVCLYLLYTFNIIKKETHNSSSKSFSSAMKSWCNNLPLINDIFRKWVNNPDSFKYTLNICSICLSIGHCADTCLVFCDKTYLRCGKHKLKHFLFQGKKLKYEDVACGKEYIEAVWINYKYCLYC
jgi:hypothetical protein